jgi:hypothetical protein
MIHTSKPVSPLRQRMIEDMTLRKLSEKTQNTYIRAVVNFTRFLGRSPDTATAEDRKRERFSTLAAIVTRCLLHVPWQQSFNLFQRVGRRDVLQYMM